MKEVGRNVTISDDISKQNIKVLREISAEVLGQHSTIRNVNWSEIPTAQEASGYICATIPICGKDIEVTFNTYFLPKETTGYVEAKNLNREINNDFVIDFFKEYCNLIYGEYKRVFKHAGLSINQTLPESYIDNDHKFHTYAIESENHSIWQLTSTGGNLYVSLEFESIDKIAAQKLTKQEEPEEEICFL